MNIKVTQEVLQSGDLPNFAICPQPSVNVSALRKLKNNFNETFFNQTRICKMKGCNSLTNFGQFVEKTTMNSNMVKEFYEDLKFSAHEVVDNVLVQLTNSTEISILNPADTKYMLPLYEMGDCPVFKVPEGLGATSRIT